MTVSRRAFLGTAGASALAVAGCAALPGWPGSAPSAAKARVAGLYSTVTNGPSEYLTILLQQAVDTVVDAGRANLDPRLVWVAIPAPAPGQSYVAGEVQALQAVLGGSGAGAIPDLVALGNTYSIRQLAQRGLPRPIDDLLGTTSLVPKDDYFPGALAEGRVEGKTYGLPLSITPGLLQYDATLFQAASLPPPDGAWDWNRLVEASLKLTQPPGQYAFAPYGVPELLVFVWQNGSDVLSADGRRCTLDDPAAVQAASFYGDLFTRHKVVAPAPQGDAQGLASISGPMTYRGARIALQFSNVLASLSPSGSLRYAEPFRGIAQATTLQLNSLLAMTSRASNPAADFAGLAALAEEMQRRSYLPPRRSLARKADPAEVGLTRA